MKVKTAALNSAPPFQTSFKPGLEVEMDPGNPDLDAIYARFRKDLHGFVDHICDHQIRFYLSAELVPGETFQVMSAIPLDVMLEELQGQFMADEGFSEMRKISPKHTDMTEVKSND